MSCGVIRCWWVVRAPASRQIFAGCHGFFMVSWQPCLACCWPVARPLGPTVRFRKISSREDEMKIKTLHLTNAWHQSSGGIATFYRALMQEANRRGQEFRLVVPAEHDRIELVGDHVKIFHLAAPPAPLNSCYRTIYPSQFLFKGSKLQSILADERPDLVEIADKYTLAYLGGLLRLGLLRAVGYRPVVVGLSHERMDDNFRSYLGNPPLGKQFCSWYMRWIYFPFFDHHIANSRYTAEELRAASDGHPVSRGTWVHHMGVNLSELSASHRSDEGRRQLRARCGATED